MSAIDDYDYDANNYNTLTGIYTEDGRSMYWTMKTGEGIMIKDMIDSHLKNTINMLKKKPVNGKRTAWIEILENESLVRRKIKIDKLKENIDLDDILRIKKQ